jgi:ubiquinone/menaquinone biosynthesis C-methylase UbiE
MAEVCPKWVGYLLMNPLRRFIQDPDKILTPFVTTGMTVLDIGPGMGYFSLPLAQMVGPGGQVVCVELQESMLEALQRRARATRLEDRITARICPPNSLGLEDFAGKIDFTLAFALVHEVPDIPGFFAEVFQVLKPGANCLVAEPRMHVSMQNFEQTLAVAKQTGFSIVGSPPITWSRTALLRKNSGNGA